MKETLNARFRAPLPEFYRRRIIVWRDEAGEFAETVAGMQLENARILRMEKNHMFEVRRQIEVDFVDENLLIYCPMTFERPQDNWLLDVFLYSEEFRADYWSLVFDELNIENQRPVREYAKTVASFFASAERRARLHALRKRYANERELRLGVLGVLSGAKEYGFAEVVRMVLNRDWDRENPALAAMEKFCGADAFWQVCAEEYGYRGKQDVQILACYMLATAALNADTRLPGLPADAAYALSAYGFFVSWLRKDREGLATLCQRVEEQFRVAEVLRHLSDNEIMNVSVFPAADGLRYEVAHELAERLTGKLSGNAACGCMIGEMPGVTPVGMAALLPHRRLEMDDSLKIRIDGMNTDAPNRENVLRAACEESVVVDAASFRQAGRAQRGELVKGKKVVYIYHDAIDRAGENDGNVFQACETAIQELMQLMRILTSELNAANVLITADHGFLYTRSPLEEYDKTGKEILQGEILEYKRRYAIIRGEYNESDAVAVSLEGLGRPELKAVFPHSCLRFRIQGGNSTYMHGGASLEEMVVPLVRYQNKKAGQKGFTAITKVDIALVGETRKISNNIFTLTFYQKQPCGGKVQPRTVLARFEDTAGRPVSDEHPIRFDLTATENDRRTVRVTFRLTGSGYDRHAEYTLVLNDMEEKAEIERIPFRIDIVFENDFL